jgi:GT2 family glycosyltransferase
MPKVAVIVLAYNSLEDTTKPCVESLLRATTGLDFRVVVVDNGSTDSTPQYLSTIAKRRKDISILLNGENLGYGAGNNKGIKSVDCEYYVLLNSDTVVTDHWLDRLIGFLEMHPEVGLAGPVSNSVTNEQMIHVASLKEEGIIQEGLAWTARCQGDFFFTDMLAFFCVAIRRELIQKIGLLDESFGLGMYEDDDYCRRASQSGCKLACLEDVFIYHKGSVSFDRVKSAELMRLVQRNRRRYEQKHGVIWHTRFAPSRFCDLIGNYLLVHQGDPERLSYKIRNKLNVLRRFSYSPPSSVLNSLKRRVAAVFALAPVVLRRVGGRIRPKLKTTAR